MGLQMRYPISEFKLFNRGKQDTIVLIPGWATDYRIFERIDLDFNYLMPTKFSPFSFERNLLTTLKKNDLDRVSVLGWSLGGFTASDFAAKHPDKINEVVLISVREKYERENIEKIRSSLNENKKACLYKFYNNCFLRNEKGALFLFKRNLLAGYLKADLDLLLEGLDYLSDSQLRLQELKGLKVKFIHGEGDKIAPMEEALKLKENLPQAKFISIGKTGHMPFFRPDFKKIFYGVKDE